MGVNKFIRFSFGPHKDLTFVGVAINTWTKWSILIALVVIDTAFNVWAGEMIWPWITNTIADHKTKNIEYPKWVCVLIVNGFYTYHGLRPLITAYLAFTQVDVVVAKIITNMVISLITTSILIKDKIYVPNRTDEETESLV